MKVVIVLLAAALVAVGAGAAWLVADVIDWFEHPMPIDSFAGLPVFRDAAGELGSWLPFVPGAPLTLIGAGIVLVPIALLVGAALRLRRVY